MRFSASVIVLANLRLLFHASKQDARGEVTYGQSTRNRNELYNELMAAWGAGYREFHHGDCIHADAEAHDIAYGIGYAVVIHPPDNDSKRAFKGVICGKILLPRATVLPAKPYLDRNRDIVAAVSRMLACPKEREEQLRSGTWATVRYARKAGNLYRIIYPERVTHVHF